MVLDNRGVGRSSAPDKMAAYSTSIMADDVLAVMVRTHAALCCLVQTHPPIRFGFCARALASMLICLTLTLPHRCLDALRAVVSQGPKVRSFGARSRICGGSGCTWWGTAWAAWRP